MDLFEDLFQASELSQFNIKNSDGTYLFDETIKVLFYFYFYFYFYFIF